MYYGRSLQIVQILVLLRVGNFFFRFGHIFLSILQYQLDKNNNSLSINIYIYIWEQRFPSWQISFHDDDSFEFILKNDEGKGCAHFNLKLLHFVVNRLNGQRVTSVAWCIDVVMANKRYPMRYAEKYSSHSRELYRDLEARWEWMGRMKRNEGFFAISKGNVCI